jgi:hypothetical protein
MHFYYLALQGAVAKRVDLVPHQKLIQDLIALYPHPNYKDPNPSGDLNAYRP